MNSFTSLKSGALLGQKLHFLLHTPDLLISTSEGRGNFEFFY